MAPPKLFSLFFSYILNPNGNLVHFQHTHLNYFQSVATRIFHWKETFCMILVFHNNNNLLFHRRTLIKDNLNDYHATKVQLFPVNNNTAARTS